uniref:Uncharacterized protein n=1 Tax=Oryza punctata TaxID=4537 RepID=A0A0E0JEF6_ORYPU
MEEWAKNAHMKAVSNLSDQIWGKRDSGQVDTSQMEEWAKNAHMKAVSNLSDQIWGKRDSGQVS